MSLPPPGDPTAAQPSNAPDAWSLPGTPGLAPPPTASSTWPTPPAAAPAPAAYAPPQPPLYQPFVPSPGPRLLAAPSYPDGYSPYMSGMVDPNARGTVFLDIPGAAMPVYLAGADTARPELYVGIKRAAGGIFTASNVTVPLVGGGSKRLKWVENWTGFPVVKMDGQKIYRTEGMTRGDRVAMFIVRLGPLLIGIIPGIFAGYGLAFWMAGMIKRGESKAMRQLLPMLIALVVPILLLVLIVAGNVASATGPRG